MCQIADGAADSHTPHVFAVIHQPQIAHRAAALQAVNLVIAGVGIRTAHVSSVCGPLLPAK
jgi:hypothetical protein